MRYLSTCSGIEAATVAWHPLGWTPVAFAETEPFPAAVLKHHYPNVPNFGDVTKFKDWPDADVDVLVGGTPCQSFSVAGLRGGMADPRGNLALVYLAIADRYRPEWLVWENVPGVLSSGGGRDFGAFIGGLAELGYHAAWRVLDAQHVRVDGFARAVPQRRRRVFVVGHLGDWRAAAAVLFERESLSGHPAPRRQAGERASPPIAGCSNGGGANGPGRTADDAEALIAFAENSRAELRLCGGDGRVAAQLTTGGGKPGQGQPCIAFDARQSDVIQYGDRTGPLDTDGHAMAVAVDLRNGTEDDVAMALQAGGIGDERGMSINSVPHARAGWAVRRLTPLECERLQGFPDGYTAVPCRGKPASDGPRYKALGNSMAVNCMRWIGRRMAHVSA